MSYAQNLWLYFLLLAGIIVLPGMDMLFVIGNSLAGGRRNGLAATAGMMAGGAMHSVAAFVGIGAILLWAPWLYTAMLCLGAAYMIWIGATLMRSSIVIHDVTRADTGDVTTVMRQAFVTCMLNPKAYMFTMSVYPQFIQPTYGPLWVQATVMGAMTVLTQMIVYGGLALGATASVGVVTGRPQAATIAARSCGALLVAIAIWTLWRAVTPHLM